MIQFSSKNNFFSLNYVILLLVLKHLSRYINRNKPQVTLFVSFHVDLFTGLGEQEQLCLYSYHTFTFSKSRMKEGNKRRYLNTQHVFILTTFYIHLFEILLTENRMIGHLHFSFYFKLILFVFPKIFHKLS